ncbi:hypothetical protein CDAR_471391 [Caerostris darwini]|uniref:Uncharacterized protein n=1 Tax=Caerostris darwini TaxID=1538125 RepID=A0AAV4RI87_9ARAC|nr:hypothetical protein CDAR_471391 [Caerostris darwini]
MNSFDDGLDQLWINGTWGERGLEGDPRESGIKDSKIPFKVSKLFCDSKLPNLHFHYNTLFLESKEKRTTEKGQTELVYRGKRNSGDYVRLYRSLCVCPLSTGHFSLPANTHDSLCTTVRTGEKESGTAYRDVTPARLDPRGVTHQKISCDHRNGSRMGFSEKTND